MARRHFSWSDQKPGLEQVGLHTVELTWGIHPITLPAIISPNDQVSNAWWMAWRVPGGKRRGGLASGVVLLAIIPPATDGPP